MAYKAVTRADQIPARAHWAIISDGSTYHTQETVHYRAYLDYETFEEDLLRALKSGDNARGIHVVETYRRSDAVEIVRS